MHLEYRKLDDGEIAMALGKLPGWTVEHGQLGREFTFESYALALAFASAVGYLAEALNHHPDLTIGYRRVRVAMHTHDVGGLSPYDFALATRIESLGG
jgi:4a-hydroxytetrahydrobiopterin dehydratase